CTSWALRGPKSYYGTAEGVMSPGYGVNGGGRPRVTNIKLTYNYPNWTRREAYVEDPGGDIRAVEGTDVTIEVHTDQPLNAAELVANGGRIAMEQRPDAPNVSFATLQVDEDGEYYISTLFNDASVKLTDD